MANPNDNGNLVNQNTLPFDASNIDVQKIAQDVYNNQKKYSFVDNAKTNATSFSTQEEGERILDARIQEQIAIAEKQVRAQETQNLFENGVDLAAGFGRYLGAGLLDILSSAEDLFGYVFTPANLMIDAFDKLAAGTNTKENDFDINPVKGLYNTIDYLVGGEDLEGNFLSRTAGEMREYAGAYNKVKYGGNLLGFIPVKDNGWSEYIINGTNQTVASAIPFIAEALVGNKVATATKIGTWGTRLFTSGSRLVSTPKAAMMVDKALAATFSSAILTTTTGHMLANDVYTRVYNDAMEKYSPELKSLKSEAYGRAYAEAIEGGKSTDEAKYLAMQAEQALVIEFAKDNKEVHGKASKHAKDGAITAANINFVPSMLLNLGTAGLFSRSGYFSRELLKSTSRFSGKEIAKEGVQEIVEEVFVEGTASELGYAHGMSTLDSKSANYGLSDLANSFFGFEEIDGKIKWNGWETMETAFWASVGSSVMTGGAQVLDYGKQPRFGAKYDEQGKFVEYQTRKERYEQQQEMIKFHNNIAQAAGGGDFLTTVTSLNQSTKDMQVLTYQMAELQKQGRYKEASQIGERLLAVQALHAFKTGTTESLIAGYEKIATSDKVSKEVRERAKEGVDLIKKMEDVYQHVLTSYGQNASEVFNNRANALTQEHLENNLQKEINSKKATTDKAIQSAMRSGLSSWATVMKGDKASLSFDMPNFIVDEYNQQVVQEGTTPTTLDYTMEEILSEDDPYANEPTSHKSEVFKKFRDKVRTDVAEVRELYDLQKTLNNVKKQKDDLNKEYNKITSPEWQKSLKIQNKAIKEIQDNKTELDKVKGTDAYLTQVNAILDKYKDKLNVEQYDALVRDFEIINLTEQLRVQQKKKEDIQKSANVDQNKNAPINTGNGVTKVDENNANNNNPTNNPPKNNPPLNPSDATILEEVAQLLVKGEQLKTEDQKKFYRANVLLVKQRVGEIKSGTSSEGNQIVKTDEKQQLVNDFVENTPVNPISNLSNITTAELNKILENKSPEEIAKIQKVIDDINNGKFFIGGVLNEGLLKRALGSLTQDVINALVTDGIITKNDEGKYVKASKESRPVSAAASKLINSDKFIVHPNDNSKVVLPINLAPLTNQVKDTVLNTIDEIEELIKDKQLSGFQIVRNVNGNPDQIMIIKESSFSLSPMVEDVDYESDESYSPLEVGEMDDATKDKVKNFVDDYTEKMKENNSQTYVPTFEDFIKDLIKQSENAIERIESRFNFLKEGWKMNKHLPQLSDVEIANAYRRLFSKQSKQDLLNDFLEFTESSSSKTVEDNNMQAENDKKELNKELSSKQKVVDDTPTGAKYEQVGVNSSEEQNKFAYSSMQQNTLKTNVYQDDGETVVESWYENEGTLNQQKLINSNKLLHPDKFLPGTVASVEIPSKEILDELKIPVRNENPTDPLYGTILLNEKGEKVYEKYSDYLDRKIKENPDFLNTQEYVDTIPMMIKDEDGDYVAFIHDVNWYHQTSFVGNRQEGIKNVRKLRQQVFEASKNNTPFNIQITEKKNGFVQFSDEFKPISVNNPNAIIAIQTAEGEFRFNGERVNVIVEQNQAHTRKNHPVILERWGTDNEGRPTYVAIPSKMTQMSEELASTMYEALLAYLYSKSYANRESETVQKYVQLSEKISKYLKANGILDSKWTDRLNVEMFIKQYTFLSSNIKFPSNQSMNFDNKVQYIREYYNNKFKKDPRLKGSPYFHIEDSNFIFGVIGEFQGQINVTSFKDDFNSAATIEALESLKKVFFNDKNYFDPTHTNKVLPVFTINGDLNFKPSEKSYEEFVKDNILSNAPAHNVGTNDNPVRVVRLQPVITFEPTSNTVNRKKDTEEVVKSNEVNAQKNNYTAEVILDEELDKAIEDAIDFSFIGNTMEEKREDAKQMLSENTNQADEFREQHLEPKLEEGGTETAANQEAIDALAKIAELQVKWAKIYSQDLNLEDLDLSEESFSPAQIEDEAVAELLKTIFKIEGLDAHHQEELTTFGFVQVKDSFKFDVIGTKINKEELVSKIKQALETKLNANKQLLEETLAKLKEIPNYQQITKVNDLVINYELALSKLNIIENNLDVLADESIAKLYQYAGLKSKIIKDEDGNETIQTEAVDVTNENPDALENDSDESLTESEITSEREDNYAQTSLEKNSKNSITSELRLFLAGIENKSSKSGNVILGVMGVETYVDFDTIYNTLQAILADKPVDFDLQIGILEVHENAHPWMKDVIAKLRGADKQIQNAFSNKMGSHALKMEFIMYSFDLRTGSYELRVTDTNSSEITKKILNNWKNNLFATDNPLVIEQDGEYHTSISVANELLAEYESWFGLRDIPQIKSAARNNFKKIFEKAKQVGDSKIYTLDSSKQLDNLVQKELEDGEKKLIGVNGKIYSVVKEGNTFTFKEETKSPVEKALTNYTALTMNEKKEAIETVQRWISYFGISLADNAIEKLFTNGMYSTTGNLLTPKEIFANASSKSASPFSHLAMWLSDVSTGKLSTKLVDPDNEYSNPLRNSSIEKALSKLQSKYSSAIVTNSFRDGKKSIYGFTAFKFITDRFNDLKNAASDKQRTEATDDIINQLKSLSFSEQSFWLNMLEGEHAGKFEISHMGLTALIEKNKKIYKDNSITSLSDTDHEQVKIGLFQDVNQGDAGFKTINGVKIPLRMARFMSPTMSDKTTMTIIKAPSFDLRSEELYAVNSETGAIELHPALIELLFEQTLLPEIKRIFAYKEKNRNGTNIKGYDEGAKMLFFLPGLNDFTLKEGDTEFNLYQYINDPSTNFDQFIKSFKYQLLPEVHNYVREVVKEKLAVWERNDNVSFFDGEYTKGIKSSKKQLPKSLVAAFDFEINQMIATANSFMTIMGDPAIYYKADPDKSKIEQAEDTLVNVGKRLAAMIAPGSKIANSETEKYYQIFLKDRVTISENIEFLTKLLDNKVFDRNEYDRISKMPVKSVNNDPIENKKLEKNKKTALKNFLKQYPKSSGYFDLETTDAQEYTTWREHLHILEGLGRMQDATINITPEEIRIAKQMFASNVPIDKMTEAQKAVLKKVMQPIKPVYTGQVYDKEQDVMRMVYIKTSSFPLIPQLTNGLELNKLREMLESVEESTMQKDANGKAIGKPTKYVRASHQSGNKVGAVKNPLDLYNSTGELNTFTKDKDGKQVIDIDTILKSALTLNRRDFKIQLDVPYKSFKKSEDVVSMGTQLTKLLFGNGILELDKVFKYNGETLSGKQLFEKYNSHFTELIKLKKAQLCEDLGVDPVTFQPINVKETALKMQKLLQEEALSKGYSKQNIDALEIKFEGNPDNPTGFKFAMPLWLTPDSNKFESMLNSIVTNRILKIKLPGASYVAGSEAGFKFQNGFENVDKNKIVWTKNWNPGTGLPAAKFDKDGKLLSAQVIAPSKFRKKDGTLIDLLETRDGKEDYVYVEKTEFGFRLKEGKIADELLKIISFRIPTSGHVSGCQLEIAGFLPNEQGDLMILPGNLTKQKGLDFDIDKETTYQLWHTVLDNGTILPLSQESKNREKVLQNEIIKIHHSIYGSNDPEVQRKINSILSIDYAKEQADMIDSLNQKDKKYFTPLSSEYQKQKMFLGASGKIGIGAFSLDVTSHSLFQQAASSGDQLSLQVPGKEPIAFKMKFGKSKTNSSEGKLGEDKTLDGSRSIVEVLMELQNIATDNEKEQVMGKVNLNSYTLDVAKVLALLGFDKGTDGNSIPFLFLSQPIIKDYVLYIANANSNLAEYNPNKEKEVLDFLANKYGFPPISDLGIEQRFTHDSIVGENLTTEMLLDEIKNGSNPITQRDVLNRFLMLKTYGESIRSIQTSMNIDSKGLPKSILENQEKIESLNNIFGNSLVVNAGALIGEFIPEDIGNITHDELIEKGYIKLGDKYILPKTIVGNFAVTGLKTASSLWEEYYPYNSLVFKKISTEILSLLQMGEVSESKVVERKQLILKEMKKFLNARAVKVLIEGENANVQTERQRLFFDDRTQGKVSLASYVQKLVKHPYFRNNNFLQTLDYDVSDTPGKPSLIKFNNTAGGNFDESYLNNALLQLMGNNIKLPAFNGEEYNTRKLAQDLINYALLEGGVQEVIQFIKLVPTSYLKEMGFNIELSKFSSLNTDGAVRLFGVNDKSVNVKADDYVPSRFAMQFIQSNPNIVPKIDNINPNLKPEEKIKISQKNTLNPADFNIVLNKDTTPPFISMRLKGEYYLWMKQGMSYVKIPTISIFGMNEYNPDVEINTVANTLVSKDKKITPQEKPLTAPAPKEPIVVSTESEALAQERFGIPADKLTQILSSIINTENLSDYLKALANAILPFVNNETKVIIAKPGQQIPNGIYNRDNNTITISHEVAKGEGKFLAKIILKEIVHSITDTEIVKHLRSDGTELNPETTPPHIKSLLQVFNAAKRGLEAKYGRNAINDVIGKIKKQREAKGKILTEKEKQELALTRIEGGVLYGATNILEFVEMMMTEPAFQKEMSEIEYGASKNVLSRFFDFINQMFNALGIKVGDNTVTKNAIDEIFNIMQNKVIPTTTQQTTGTIYDTSKFSISFNKDTKMYEVLADDGALIDEYDTLDEAKQRLKETIKYFDEVNKKQTQPTTTQEVSKADLEKLKQTPEGKKIEENRKTSLNNFDYDDAKNSDMTIVKSTITYLNGKTEVVSDLLDVTANDSKWRLKQEINKKYDEQLIALAQTQGESKTGYTNEENEIIADAQNVFLEIQDLIDSDLDSYNELDKVTDATDYYTVKRYPNLTQMLKNSEGVITYKEFLVLTDNSEFFEEYVKKHNIKDIAELSEKILSEEVIQPTQVPLHKPTDADVNLGNQIDDASEAFTPFILFKDTNGENVLSNREQTHSISHMTEFLKDDAAKHYVLTGGGGTGKTTILRKVLELNAAGKTVVGGTIAHTAKEILKQSLGNSAQISTIAAMIGLKLNESTNEFTFDKYFDISQSPLNGADIVIIDECSMIDEIFIDRFNKILSQIAPNAKVIFMGDDAQLPPIRKDRSQFEGKDSPTFSMYSKNYTSMLTQKMRQKPNSSIATLGEIIAANVRAQKPVKDIIGDNQEKLTGKDVSFMTEVEAQSKMEKQFKENPHGTKIIAYRDAVRKKLNDKIREILFGKEGAKRKYNEGEAIMLSFNNETSKTVDGVVKGLFNGQHYEIVTVKERPKALNFAYYDTDSGKLKYKAVDGYEMTIKNKEGDEFKIITHDPDQLNYKEYAKLQSSLYDYYSSLDWKKYKQEIKAYQAIYNDNKNIFKAVEYGYALTSHKAQGSGFKNVFVYKSDILSSGTSKKTINQSLYVAVTRAEQDLTVVTDSENNLDNIITVESFSPLQETSFEEKTNELAKKVTTYLSNFGITVNDYSELKDKFNIDDFGFADILSKIANISDATQLPEVAGEFIAYMMQHNGLVTSMVRDFARVNKELITTKNAIHYVASGLGKSELVRKNPNKFADMDDLIANAVKKIYGEDRGTMINSKLVYEDDRVQAEVKKEIQKVMETKIILSPIEPEKLKLIGFRYKKYYIPSETNIDKIISGISSRTTNPYNITKEKYKKLYVDPYFENEKINIIDGYISDEYTEMNDLSQLLEEFLDRSEYFTDDNYNELKKEQYFKIIGNLIGRELKKRSDIPVSKSLFEKIKDIIKKFFSMLNKQQLRNININVGLIVDAVLSNDKDFITRSKFKPGEEGKPVSQVSIEKALATDTFGKSIIYTLAEEGFLLTGSTALSEQGTILRPDENPLHDIDWVSPFSRQETEEKFKKHYPNAIKVRVIENSEYTTDSFLIAPEGHYIDNYQQEITPSGKILIKSYEVKDENGNVVGTYNMTMIKGKADVKELNVKAKVIDFFSYPDYNARNKYEASKYTTKEGQTIGLANWKDIFNAKLEWSRYKDIWDYNRFTPNEQDSLSLQIEKLIQRGIIKAKCD